MDAMSTLTEFGRQDRRRAAITNPRLASSGLREKKCHTMPSKFRANSLKTKDGGPHEVSHFFGSSSTKFGVRRTRRAEHFGRDGERQTHPAILVRDFHLARERRKKRGLPLGHLAARSRVGERHGAEHAESVEQRRNRGGVRE